MPFFFLILFKLKSKNNQFGIQHFFRCFETESKIHMSFISAAEAKGHFEEWIVNTLKMESILRFWVIFVATFFDRSIAFSFNWNFFLTFAGFLIALVDFIFWIGSASRVSDIRRGFRYILFPHFPFVVNLFRPKWNECNGNSLDIIYSQGIVDIFI